MKKTIITGCEGRDGFELSVKPYLIRYTLFEKWDLKICIHVFIRSDAEELHDHPWNFVSIILWRGYIEVTPGGRSRKYPGMVLYRKATHQHRVELMGQRKSITLVFMGKRLRTWGFITKSGWLQWTKYFIQNKC